MRPPQDPVGSSLARLAALPDEDAVAAFLRCCGSRRWAEAMARGRPYADEAALLASAERAAEPLAREDWLEAFAQHPRIGDRAALAARLAPAAASPASDGTAASARAVAWSAAEQRGVDAAGEDLLDALVAGNRAYEARFGHIFIACATGKSAGEMLALLRARLANEPGRELAIAAAEQRKITALRLSKLLQEGP